MKKLYFLIILASMTFLLASCTDEKAVEPPPDDPPECVGDECDDIPAPPTEVGDSMEIAQITFPPYLYDPIKGQIKIGDSNIKDIKINNLREHIGYVSQEIFMFDGSVKDNIAYPPSNNNLDDVILAAKQSQAHEFIEKLPNGYDTFIGERGQKLSVGQKQRIAIARALYKNPQILIFDEATSAVDNETELLLQKALNEIAKERTTIVIAHRLSTIRNADTTIVIDQNNISEMGDHDKLISENGTYKKLWDIQTGKLI